MHVFIEIEAQPSPELWKGRALAYPNPSMESSQRWQGITQGHTQFTAVRFGHFRVSWRLAGWLTVSPVSPGPTEPSTHLSTGARAVSETPALGN